MAKGGHIEIMDDQWQLQLCSLNHRKMPQALWDKIAIGPEFLQLLHKNLSHDPLVREHLILRTCNRLEIYGVFEDSFSWDSFVSSLSKESHLSENELEAHRLIYAQKAAIEHLFSLACGLESELIGETEILGQLKQAYRKASELGSTSKFLHKLFQKSFQVAKWIRSHTQIGQGNVSLGNVAVGLANRIFEDLSESKVLIVGSGQVGTDTAQAFRSRGCQKLFVTSRTPENAYCLQSIVGGHYLDYKNWKSIIPEIHILVVCVSGKECILSKRDLIDVHGHSERYQPLFLLDLGVPQNTEKSINDLPNIFQYNFHELADIANGNLKLRQSEINICKDYIEEKSQELIERMNASSLGATNEAP